MMKWVIRKNSIFPGVAVFIVLLAMSACSGTVEGGRLASHDQIIALFKEHRSEFDELKDQLLQDPKKAFIVYEQGTCWTPDGEVTMSSKQLQVYLDRLKRLNLPSVSKSLDWSTNTPNLEFPVSAIGLAGGGHVRSLYFSPKTDPKGRGSFLKIDAVGWYLHDEDEKDLR